MAIARLGRIISRQVRWGAACAALLCFAPLACGGSQLRTGVVHDYPVYYVDGPPHRLRNYPSASYHGRPAYLVDGRWYYSTPRGWVYFRDEPRELRLYRERTVRARGSRDRKYDDGRAEPSERRRSRGRDRDEPTERRHRSGNN